MAEHKLRRRAVLAAGAGAAAGIAGIGSSSAPAAPKDPGRLDPQAVSVTPDDQQYPDCIRGMNQRYIGNPEKVQIVNSTKQVVQAVQEAVDQKKRLTVVSSGHCFEDFIFDPAVQVVIDVSKLNAIHYDPARNAIAIGSGATVLEVYETLYKDWGVTVPAGLCYSVGMGGHITGGAWGSLCRTHGLAVDHLYAVEVVVVDAKGHARAVVATREPDDPNRELWWAHTGGGGGNFGVVTRFWFRSPGAEGTDPRKLLPAPPREILISAVAWSWSDIDQADFMTLARNFGRWQAANSAVDSPQRAVAGTLLLNHRSNGQLGLFTLVDATADGAEQMLHDYVAFIQNKVSVPAGALTNAMADFNPMPEYAAPTRLPWLQATRFIGTTNSALNDPTLRGEYKSAFMRAAHPDDQLAALYRSLISEQIENPLAGVQFTPYGGQVGAVAPSATASVHRSAVFKMLWSALWNDPAQDEQHIEWVRESYRSTYAGTGGVPVPGPITDGCYVNYCDIDLSDPRFNKSGTPWSTLYYKENYPRLQRVKLRWDPTNFFRHKQSIELPTS